MAMQRWRTQWQQFTRRRPTAASAVLVIVAAVAFGSAIKVFFAQPAITGDQPRTAAQSQALRDAAMAWLRGDREQATRIAGEAAADAAAQNMPDATSALNALGAGTVGPDSGLSVPGSGNTSTPVAGLFPQPVRPLDPVETFTPAVRAEHAAAPPLGAGSIAVMSYAPGSWRPVAVSTRQRPRIKRRALRAGLEVTGPNAYRLGRLAEAETQLIAASRITGAEDVRVTVRHTIGREQSVYYVAYAIDDGPWQEAAVVEREQLFLTHKDTLQRPENQAPDGATGAEDATFQLTLPDRGAHVLSVALVATDARADHYDRELLLAYDCGACTMEAARWPGAALLRAQAHRRATDTAAQLQGYAAGLIEMPRAPASGEADDYHRSYRAETPQALRAGHHYRMRYVATESGLTEFALGARVRAYLLPAPGIYALDTGMEPFAGTLSGVLEDGTAMPLRVRPPGARRFRPFRPGELVVPRDAARKALAQQRQRIRREYSGTARQARMGALPERPRPVAGRIGEVSDAELLDREAFRRRIEGK
ncbi:hypothetical protein [Arhodomonas sp. SL1]|uniref:hypothetical protein n=1 Tax=Arhodomonas sp. SL1 TaxID=3425691 RepID=UPI003F88209A